MTDRDVPVLLDVTRLVSRVGRGPLTGVDRVELAYLEWCLGTDTQLHGLARIADGYVLLDRSGLKIFHQKLVGEAPWGARDLRARVGLKTSKARGRVEADLRRLAVARSGKSKLPKLPCSIYVNVGHANLTETTLVGVVDQELKAAVLLHDMIPLDFPQFQRVGTPTAFEQKMRAVAKHAALVVSNSMQTEARVRAYFDDWGAHPIFVKAHLGLTQVERPVVAENRPYYCVIGTIEPRKNHRMVLDIWDEFSDDQAPDLHIIGQRGWNNDEVFKRLDALSDKPWFHEHNELEDVELVRLLAGSHGLLFPSFAEGFGFPSLEAAQLGVPVICGDLAIHREVLGDYPVYADLEDRYFWKKTITEQVKQRQKDLVRASQAKTVKIPTWSEHFGVVNAALKSLI